jgi:ankyrin repeat protein
VQALLATESVEINRISALGGTSLFMACRGGHTELLPILIKQGADVNRQTDEGESPLFVAASRGHNEIVELLIDAGASRKRSAWMGIAPEEAAIEMGRLTVQEIFRAYESEFAGNIVATQGAECTASWPGIYAKSWDALVAQSKNNELSAAVVFIPQHTKNFGMCGGDKCYCIE